MLYYNKFWLSGTRWQRKLVHMDDSLLEILCCPQTHLPLQRLDGDQLERLNRLIADGQLRNLGDEPVTQALEAALVTRNGRLVYPVRDGIPILLQDECIDQSVLQG